MTMKNRKISSSLMIFILLSAVFSGAILLSINAGVVTGSSQGTLLFSKTWGGSGDDGPAGDHRMGGTSDSSGNIYVVGSTTSFGAGGTDVLLLKYDSTGSLQWQRTWGGSGNDFGQFAATDSNGNIYVTGFTTSFGLGTNDVILLKFASNGTLLWQKTWGGSGEDSGFGVALDSIGNIYVTGQTDSFGAGLHDVFLLKFDSAGDLLWQRTWGGSNNDGGYAVCVDSSNDVYVTGNAWSFGAGNNDVVVLKYDPTGNLLWQKIWGGSGIDSGFAIGVDSSNFVYVTGQTYSFGAGGEDAFLLKYDPTDNLVWQKTWGGTGSDEARGLINGSGSIYVTGYTTSYGSGSGDAILLNFASDGTLLSQKTWGGSNDDRGFGIALDSGNVVVTGYVSEGSPYSLGSPTFALGTPSGSDSTPSGSIGTPTVTLGTPTGIIGQPSGSQTYAGGQDIFIFEYGSTASTLSLTPSTGFASTTITGSGFAANSIITITWDGATIPTVPSPLVTDASGNFSAILSVPTQNSPGIHVINATDLSGSQATANFTVINMTGSQGPKGDTGLQGSQGPPGEAQGFQSILIYIAIIVSIVALILALVSLLKKSKK